MVLSKAVLGEAQSTFLAGRYNVLLGAGASKDSLCRAGHQLPSGNELRDELVGLRGNFRKTSSLSRIYGALTPHERSVNITERLSGTSPGPSYIKLCAFYWKRIYTLNIDDAIEAAYNSPNAKQKIDCLNHKSDFRDEPNPEIVQVVHVHGSVKKPTDGYIFSIPEYVNSMGPGSPWIDVLANTLTTEPFIVAGTSLEEPDIAYFLAKRDKFSVRSDRGPSFFVEPFPDEGTLAECEKYGLHLFEGTLEQFLDQVSAAIPVRPLPIGAAKQLDGVIVDGSIDPRALAIFARDFSIVISRQEVDDNDLSFYAGREPQLRDIALLRDIPRVSTARIAQEIERTVNSGHLNANFMVVDDIAGGGKTTALLRCLYNLADRGFTIFRHVAKSSLSLDACAKVLNAVKTPFILFVDDFADHASAIMELYKRIDRNDFLVLCSERAYRVDHAVRVMEGHSFRHLRFDPFSQSEAELLIEKMNQLGLTSTNIDAKRAAELRQESIATAVCRIMSDFRPIEEIVASLIEQADDARLDRYLGVSIASYCYRTGLRYDIVSSAFDRDHLKDQMLNMYDILPIGYSDNTEKEYVAPMNQTLAHQILIHASRARADDVFEIYCRLGEYLASYVNRSAIVKRTPEARIAGRLFDFDEAVSTLLRDRAEAFYVRMKRHWGWNSRYWEQQALMKLADAEKSSGATRLSALAQSISHARHAVKIEKHPHPLTTLGRVLFAEMRIVESRRETSFNEAFRVLVDAIRIEGGMSRVAIHPYATLFRGTVEYIGYGGHLDDPQRKRLRPLLENATSLFRKDGEILRMVGKIDVAMR